MVSVPRSVFLAVVTAAATSAELDFDDFKAVVSAARPMTAVAVGASQQGGVSCPLRAAGLWCSNAGERMSEERQRFYRGFDDGMMAYLSTPGMIDTIEVLPDA